MSPRTSQRIAIEAAIDSAEGPVSPAEVLESARRSVPTISLATVYRTLKRMLEDGEISMVVLAGQSPRYERAQIAREHHHHFLCKNCDTVYDLDGCVEGLRKLLPRGFQMTEHEITISGQCRACRQAS